jgi:signal peptidase II
VNQNNTAHRRGLMVAIIVAIILIADQILKIWVKTHFFLGESFHIFSWFQLVFIQNNGMAFGWEIGSKLMLTILRIITVGFLIFYLFRTHARKEASTGYLMWL